MRTIFAVKGEARDALERWEPKLSGFPNPSGVSRVVVKKNARVVREAPGKGAAKRGRAGSRGHWV